MKPVSQKLPSVIRRAQNFADKAKRADSKWVNILDNPRPTTVSAMKSTFAALQLVGKHFKGKPGFNTIQKRIQLETKIGKISPPPDWVDKSCKEIDKYVFPQLKTTKRFNILPKKIKSPSSFWAALDKINSYLTTKKVSEKNQRLVYQQIANEVSEKGLSLFPFRENTFAIAKPSPLFFAELGKILAADGVTNEAKWCLEPFNVGQKDRVSIAEMSLKHNPSEVLFNLNDYKISSGKQRIINNCKSQILLNRFFSGKLDVIKKNLPKVSSKRNWKTLLEPLNSKQLDRIRISIKGKAGKKVRVSEESDKRILLTYLVDSVLPSRANRNKMSKELSSEELRSMLGNLNPTELCQVLEVSASQARKVFPKRHK